MVALYQELIIRSLEEVTPLLHSLPDAQELPVIGDVVPFGT